MITATHAAGFGINIQQLFKSFNMSAIKEIKLFLTLREVGMIQLRTYSLGTLLGLYLCTH